MILTITGVTYASSAIPTRMMHVNSTVTRQLEINEVLMPFEISLVDFLLAIYIENLIPLTPMAIRHGTIMISLGSSENAEKRRPLIPNAFIMKPELKPIMKPFTDIIRNINGIPIIVKPSNHNSPTSFIFSTRPYENSSLPSIV
jgi:hypothetical protein